MFLQNWESNSKFQMNLCFWESLSIFQDFTMQRIQCSKNSTVNHTVYSWSLAWCQLWVLVASLTEGKCPFAFTCFCRLVWNVLKILECSAHQICTHSGIFSIILLRLIYKYFITLIHNINQIIYYKNTQIFDIIFRGL